MLIKGFPLGVMAANCYLAETDDAAFVVDPSDYDVRIADFLRQSSDKEKFILLTHCHFDHIMGADTVRELFGAKIIIETFESQNIPVKEIFAAGGIAKKDEIFTSFLFY